jgi:hypothetical protein
MLLTLLLASQATQLESIDFRAANLTSVCKKLTITSAKPLRVEAALADRKLSLQCSSLPTETVREQIAAYLGAEWIESKHSVTLQLTKDTKRKEAERRAERRSAIRTMLSETLRLLDWAATQDEKSIRLVQSGDRKYTGPKLTSLSAEERNKYLVQRLAFRVASQACKRLNGSLDELLAGRQITLRDVPPTRETGPKDAPPAFSLIRFSPGARELRFVCAESNKSDVDDIIPLAASFALPAPKEVADSLERIPSDPSALSAYSLKNEIPEKTTVPYGGQAMSLAEHAWRMFKAYDIPVIADGYRVAVSGTQFPANGPLSDYLARLRQTSITYPFAPILGWKMHKGFLQIRHDDDLALQETEIPERLLEPMEAEASKNGAPSLQSYIRMATTIKDRQREFFEARRKCLVAFPTVPLRQHMAHLRFLGQLSPMQGKLAQGEGLVYTSLTPPQKQSFQDALATSVTCGIVTKPILDSLLDGSSNFDDYLFSYSTMVRDAYGSNPELVVPESKALTPSPSTFVKFSFLSPAAEQPLITAFTIRPLVK